MKKNIQVGLISLLILGIVNCRKNSCSDPTNPKCSDYNPCYNVHPLSAAFNIYENDCTQGPGEYDTSWHYYPTDTVFTNCVTFTACDSTADSVRWTIGAGSYTARSFHLDFTGQKSQPVPITLTVYKHRNSCYPTDDTVKTLTKNLYFTDSCYALGSYTGYFDNNPADTGTVAIILVDTSLNTAAYHIKGFIPGCNDAYGGSQGTGGSLELFYSSIHFEGNGSLGTCDGATGSLYYNKLNRTVTIQFKTVKSLNSTVIWNLHNFNGYKIN